MRQTLLFTWKKGTVYKKSFWLWISWKSHSSTCTSYNKTGVVNASWVKQWKRRNTSLWNRHVPIIIIIIVITVSTVKRSRTLWSCCKTKAWCNTVPLVHDLPKWSKKSHSWALLLNATWKNVFAEVQSLTVGWIWMQSFNVTVIHLTQKSLFPYYSVWLQANEWSVQYYGSLKNVWY